MCKKWTLYTELQVKIKALLVLSLAFCPRNTYFVGSNRHDHKTGDQQLHNCYCSSCTFHGQGRPLHIQSSSFCSQLWKKRENVGTFSMSAIPPRRPIWKFWCDFPSPHKVADKVVDMVADEKEKEKKGHAKKKNKRYPIWWESWSRGWLIGPNFILPDLRVFWALQVIFRSARTS